jgi:hypothetical protein
VPATAPAAVAAAQKKLGGENVKTVLDVKIFAQHERRLRAFGRASFAGRIGPDGIAVLNHSCLVYRKSASLKKKAGDGSAE